MRTTITVVRRRRASHARCWARSSTTPAGRNRGGRSAGTMRCLVALLVLLATAWTVAGEGVRWADKRFNYQIGLPFNLSQHALPGIDVYFIDLFDNSAEIVEAMKQAKMVPVCYFSAGTWEARLSDAGLFPTSALGKPVPEVGGQRWLDVRDTTVRSIMAQRMQLCKTKGFLAVDPGSTDSFLYDNGLNLTRSDLRDYVMWLSTTARGLGLEVGLLNTVALIDAPLVAAFDFAVNTACYDLNECHLYEPFKSAGKAVFQIEYGSAADFPALCADQAKYGLTTIRKDKQLAAFPYVTCAPAPRARNATDGPAARPDDPAAPPASPLDSIAFVQLAMVGGNLRLRARGPSGDAPAPARTVGLNGTLTILGTSGLGLLLGPADFSVQPRVDWEYDRAASAFVADVLVSGTAQLVSYEGARLAPSTSAARRKALSCVLDGQARLVAKEFPGPGFNVRADWSLNLTLVPNPWNYFAALPAAGARCLQRRRRALASASPEDVDGGGGGDGDVGDDGGDDDAYDDAYPPAQPAPRRRRLQQQQVTAAAAADVGVTVLLSGSVASSEAPPIYLPSTAEDRARNDSTLWLDPDGGIRVIATLPTELIPAWKDNPDRPAKALAIPWWALWLLVAVGALIVALLLACCVLLLVRRARRNRAGASRTGSGRGLPVSRGGAAASPPASPTKVLATVVSNSSAVQQSLTPRASANGGKSITGDKAV